MKRMIQKIVAVCTAIFMSGTAVALTGQPDDNVRPETFSTVISWVTDKPSTSQVEFGRSSTVMTDRTPEYTALVVYHKVRLEDLEPSTTYYYRIVSQDADGRRTISDVRLFKTAQASSARTPPVISDIEAETIVAAAPANPDERAPAGEPAASSATQLIKKEEPIEKALIEKGGILLKKGKWQIEPSTTYIHTSANKIAVEGYTILPVLVVGEISTERVKRDIFVETLTARYGLGHDLQWDLNLPFRAQHERVSVDAPASESTRSATGMGDISTGISYQFAREKGLRPDLIAGISVKAPTGKEPYGHTIGLGTGHWGIKGNVVAVKSSDPAIVFANTGFTYNVQRNDINDYGTIKPGNTFDYGLGVAFALNYNVALSFQLQQAITERMRMNGNMVPGSFTNVATFKYGLTWSMSKNFSCEVAAGHGLTTDAPNFMLEVSCPFTF